MLHFPNTKNQLPQTPRLLSLSKLNLRAHRTQQGNGWRDAWNKICARQETNGEIKNVASIHLRGQNKSDSAELFLRRSAIIFIRARASRRRPSSQPSSPTTHPGIHQWLSSVCFALRYLPGYLTSRNISTCSAPPILFHTAFCSICSALVCKYTTRINLN